MTIAACPACGVAPAALDIAGPEHAAGDEVFLSLPNIHCAACIGGVERALRALPQVRAARVNLRLRRATVVVAPDTDQAVLIDALAQAGHEVHELDGAALTGRVDPVGRDLLVRLAVAGFAMMNVMVLSIAVWSGATDATRDLFHWISAAIALPAVVYVAQPFFQNAWRALRVRRLNMDVPISLAIILASMMSLFEASIGGQHAYFDAALSLSFFLLTGRYLDHRTRSAARSAAQELAALEVPRATRIVQGVRSSVAVADLRVGDHIVIAAGGRIPVDGTLLPGDGLVDRSMLTGESLPVAVTSGDVIAAGEVVVDRPLVIEATAVGADTTLRRMAALVEVAETSRNRYTALADRAAAVYAPLVHGLALAAFIGWYIATGDAHHALNVAVATLIITCPCALGLAVPAVTTAASGRLFRMGLLIKSPTALERLAQVDTVVFDKTGTLTQGRASLSGIHALTQDQASIARALAHGSNHPVARAVADALRDVEPALLTNVHEVTGEGVFGLWHGRTVFLGRGTDATELRIDGQPSIPLPMQETLRAGAADAVHALDGLQLHVMSGDTVAATRRLAAQAGIPMAEGDLRPADKLSRINTLSDQGRHVLMVGDGLNDTAALAAAHVSLSPASALDASRAASDIVLLGNSFAPLPDALRISRKARARIRENFAIAVLYNCVAIPVALAGFATPLAAALAMSTSSITVILNSMRVR